MSKILTATQVDAIVTSLAHATDIGATEYSITTLNRNGDVIRFEMSTLNSGLVNFCITRRTVLGVLTGMEFFTSCVEFTEFYNLPN